MLASKGQDKPKGLGLKSLSYQTGFHHSVVLFICLFTFCPFYVYILFFSYHSIILKFLLYHTSGVKVSPYSRCLYLIRTISSVVWLKCLVLQNCSYFVFVVESCHGFGFFLVLLFLVWLPLQARTAVLGII